MVELNNWLPDYNVAQINAFSLSGATAKYFGKDPTPYYKGEACSLELFANFKPKGFFYPNEGKERAARILKNIDNQKVDKNQRL